MVGLGDEDTTGVMLVGEGEEEVIVVVEVEVGGEVVEEELLDESVMLVVKGVEVEVGGSGDVSVVVGPVVVVADCKKVKNLWKEDELVIPNYIFSPVLFQRKKIGASALISILRSHLLGFQISQKSNIPSFSRGNGLERTSFSPVPLV